MTITITRSQENTMELGGTHQMNSHIYRCLQTKVNFVKTMKILQLPVTVPCAQPNIQYLGMQIYNREPLGMLLCYCLVAKSIRLFCDPIDYSPPGSSVHGISQARILEWVAFPSPGDLLDPETGSASLALQADSLPLCH